MQEESIINNFTSHLLCDFLDKQDIDAILKLFNEIDCYDTLKQIVEYINIARGKCFRIALCTSYSKMMNMPRHTYTLLSFAVELIHCATLVHDDVVDQSKIRRGKKAVHVEWSNAHAVLTGDYMTAYAMQTLCKLGSIDVLKIFSSCSQIISQGEIFQLSKKNHFISFEEYLQIISCKTAALFCHLALAVCSLKSSSCQISDTLYLHAYNLGICFQIVDDILDYFGDESHTKKTLYTDLFESKMTVLFLFALKFSKKEEKEILQKSITDEQFARKNINNVIGIMNKYNCQEKAYDLAKFHMEQACLALKNLPKEYNADHIVELTERVFLRKF